MDINVGATSSPRPRRLDGVKGDVHAGRDHFCFLLSSTAGGCGLNLIGGSRLAAALRRVAAAVGADGGPATLAQVRRAAEQPFSDLRKAGRAGAVLAPALGRLDRAWRALVPALQDLVAEDLPPVEEDAAPAAAGAPAAPPPTGPACKAQVDLPNDDDLANWSHHASVATTGDEVLKSAMAGSALVSFVFGMEVTADLVRAHAAS